MVSKIIAGISAGIIGSLFLGIILAFYNSFKYTDNFIVGALIYYCPALILLTVFTRLLIHTVEKWKILINFLSNEIGITLILLFVMIIVLVRDNFVKDIDFFDAFSISFLLNMLIYNLIKKFIEK